MRRISISLPEELVTRLEPVKDKINVSQVCREALERRIAIHTGASIVNGDGLDLDSLIDRLREERDLIEGTGETMGKRNAGAWLSTASYVEIKSVVERPPSSGIEKYRLPSTAFRTMKRDMEESDGAWGNGLAVAYKTAWLDYVTAIWGQIEERVQGAPEPVAKGEPAE